MRDKTDDNFYPDDPKLSEGIDPDTGKACIDCRWIDDGWECTHPMVRTHDIPEGWPASTCYMRNNEGPRHCGKQAPRFFEQKR